MSLFPDGKAIGLGFTLGLLVSALLGGFGGMGSCLGGTLDLLALRSLGGFGGMGGGLGDSGMKSAG